MLDITRAGFLGASAAFSLAAVAPALAQTALPKVRIGVTPAEAYAQAYYAADSGFFQRGGLDATVDTLNSGSAAANALLGGSLDIGITTPLLLANAIQRKVPFVVIAGGPLSTPDAPQSLLCVTSSSPIKTAKDLEGKTVGMIVLKTVVELSLDAWLDKNDANRANVRRVEVLFSEMQSALERGRVDACIISEPFITPAVRSGTVRILANPNLAIAPSFMLGAWFTTKAFAQQNPDTVKKYADVMYLTAKWANTHRAETAAIISKYMKIDPAVTRSMYRLDFVESMRFPEMQALLDCAVKYGALQRPIVAADMMLRA
jgi:NitT/TauT family transport system substrate-binding protein